MPNSTLLMLPSPYYSPEPKHSFERITETLYEAQIGVDAYGYYSAESDHGF